MHLEHPIQEEHVRLFMNKPVGVILRDGTRRFGIVTGCGNGSLELNGTAAGEVSSKRTRKKVRVRTKKIKKKSPSTKGVLPPPLPPYSPVPFGPPVQPIGPAVSIDLATIALLFLLLP
jgi:hypothetical protein